MGKGTAQNDTIIDTTSDSQVNSNSHYRWSPASLTFYQFLYLYITRITINNNTPHLKSPKNQNRRASLGQPAMKLLGGLIMHDEHQMFCYHLCPGLKINNSNVSLRCLLWSTVYVHDRRGKAGH